MVFTKFNVGYPTKPHPEFIDRIIERRSDIGEVYFAFAGFASGRGRQDGGETDELPWEAHARQLDDLRRISDAGISLDLLLNGNCYGGDSLARSFFLRLGDTVDWLASRYRLTAVTTASPMIAKFIHDNFEGMDVRASVNLGIGTIPAMDAVSGLFDSFYLKREYNRNFAEIRRIKAWCDQNGKGLYMLANSGCMNECPMRTFHDNIVAHEDEIARADNAYVYKSLCRSYLESPEKQVSIVRDMNYVRPEDLHLYEEFFPSVKLATRVASDPVRTLDAYLDARYVGAVTDLLEPDNGISLRPAIVDNSRFPADFAARVGSCDKQCETCGYCAGVYKNARVELDKIEFI
ncbi:MAG: hypothetical protein E7632_11260 [Ruminococcaceae bacterium]|nr:hypothetical protein [Oscillospiraceae bacterium]